MTTKNSPLHVLKAQANNIAAKLKAFERGEKIEIQFARKLEQARGKQSIKFGIVMDDKVIMIDMPWATISNTSEAGIAEYIFGQMREARHVVN